MTKLLTDTDMSDITSKRSICKLLLLMSIPELKDMVVNGIRKIIELIKITPTTIIKLIYRCYIMLSQLHFRMKNKTNTDMVIYQSYKDYQIPVDADKTFIELIDKYLTIYKDNVKYNCVIIKCITDGRKLSFVYNINDIMITYGNYNIIIDANLYITKSIDGNLISYSSFAGKLNHFWEMFKDEDVRKCIKEYIEYHNKNVETQFNSNKQLFPNIIKFLQQNFNQNMRHGPALIVMYQLTNQQLINKCDLTPVTKIFNKLFVEYINEIKLAKNYISMYTFNDICSIINCQSICDVNKMSNIHILSYCNDNTNQTINLTIQSTIEEPTYETYKSFIKSVYALSNGICATNNKIGVHFIGLKTNKIITRVPIPKEHNLDGWEKIPKNDNESKDLTQYQTIETIEKVINAQQENSTFRDMNALCLKTTDKKRLMSALHYYTNCTEKLAQWGMQKKLNILLHGPPGTGKSTSILCIASHLGKDIYYLDTQNVETNEELKKLFDYVNNLATSGIIVMEEIDTLLPCIRKRTGNIKATTGITLDFILNMLQGSLTKDGFMFICTTNHLEHLDPAFYRSIRIDVLLQLEACNHEQIQTIFMLMKEQDIPQDILKKIPELKYTPADIMTRIKECFIDDYLTPDDILKPFFMSTKQDN